VGVAVGGLLVAVAVGGWVAVEVAVGVAVGGMGVEVEVGGLVGVGVG